MNDLSDEKYMREALVEAAKARDDDDWAIGCVIVLDDEIIVRGRNRVHSSQNRLCHAEMDALEQLQSQNFDRQHKERLVLYTTFEPCPMCFGAILVSGVRHVVSGVDFDRSGVSSYIDHIPHFFKQPRYETTFMTGVLARECAEMWMSGCPAREIIAGGYQLPISLDELTDMQVKTYRTPAMAEVD